MKPSTAQVVTIGETFSSDTIFDPFTGNHAVYSFRLYGSIQLYGDSSLVRIVLVDAYGIHLLIYESYPLITDTNSFTLSGVCDETCFLDGIVPDSLRVDIISAFCTIDSLKFDTNYIPNATELQAQSNWINDSVKIAVMNQRIKEEHMYWRAGRTNIAEMSFNEKSQLFGTSRFSLQGFEYYQGGIFEFLSHRERMPTSSTSIVSSFNWRDRHGANNISSNYFGGDPSPYWDGDVNHGTGWITHVWDQEGNTCWAYASVAAVEARTNLFFNTHYTPSTPSYSHIDLDLSEWDVVSCLGKPPCPNNYGWPSEALSYIKTNGVVNQECLDNSCSNDCADKDLSKKTERVTFEGWDTVSITSEDWMKKVLITEGPWVATIKGSVFHQTVSHSMLLVGYQRVGLSDYIYTDKKNPENNIVIDSGCELLGQSIYIFKNSWDSTWGDNGFTSLTYYPIYISDFYSDLPLRAHCRITGDILREGHTNSEIVWSDEDDDGYYWWGIGEKPTACPGNPAEEDCDDSNPDVGPYNLNNENLPLYECLPICTEFNSTPYSINEDEIIESDRHFNRNVVVLPGSTLTIRNCVVSFSESGRLIVQQGGKLILENSTLTTKCPGVMWGGIQVWGNSLFPQSNLTHHGHVDMINSTIENAQCAVTTVKYEYNQEYGGAEPVPTMSGGKITAVNSKFYNNTVAIEFYPYSFENESSINFCTFKTTDAYRGLKGPDYFVKMSGVFGIPITCCSFINTRIGNIGFEGWGGGIYCFNSSLDILNQGCYTTEVSTLFRGLTRAIYAINSGDDKMISIRNANFEDNYRGIYLSGMSPLNPPTIVLNYFKICDPPPAIDFYPYGLYLDNCSGYHIEENLFESTSSLNLIKIGLIVNNSGPDYNKIYRNTFRKLYAGIIAQNKNRSINGMEGLELKCNIFSRLEPNSNLQCKYDISVTVNEGSGLEYGIRPNQGEPFPMKSSDCAGNVFSEDIPDPDQQQWQFLNYGSFLNYNHHHHGLGGENVDPARINADVVPVSQVYSFIYEDSCPDELDLFDGNADTLKESLSAYESSIDSLSTVLIQVVDGGNTDQTNSYVNSSWPQDSISVRNELLTDSPFLSDTVIKSSIAKENVLSSEMITEILSANPHASKSDQVLAALSIRNNQLTDIQLGTIMEGLGIIGPKESLEIEIANNKIKHTKALSMLTSYYRNHYTSSEASDSIISLFFAHGNLHRMYDASIEFLCRFDTLNAKLLFNSVPTKFTLSVVEQEEYDNLREYLSARIEMIKNGDIIINPDSVVKARLYAIISDVDNIPSVFARNLLISSDTLNYEESIILPQPELKHGNNLRDKKYSLGNAPTFNVFPNPASLYFIVEHEFLLNVTGRLDLIDATGRLCKRVYIKPGSKYEVMNISDITSGLYICNLTIGEKNIGTKKICITK